jgi:hypothetical protein
MKKEIKKDVWKDNVLVFVSRDTRAKLKLKAILKGLTLKEYLEKIANEKTRNNRN